MRIVHYGRFLQEGFHETGCDVIPLPLDATKTLNELVEQTGAQPDVVFLELFGKTPLPKEIFNSRYTLAAYCIDSPLNEYWLVPLMKLFDFVYVDQLSSVAKFRRNGVQAKWLPLCVSRTDFRTATAKKHGITFVGRMTPYRVKRNNLITYLRREFPVNVVEGIAKPDMLDLFASSRIVLNENFFSGLNLRFFQALASGSLLLTERNGSGVSAHFCEGKHYVGYSPDDVVATIRTLERAYESYEPTATCGQETCLAQHTSASRARIVLDDLAARPFQAKLPLHERQLNEANSKYCHAVRFGGNFDESVTLINAAANTTPEGRSQALCVLGSMHLRSQRNEAGVDFLEKSASVATVHGVNALLKLMLFFADNSRFYSYLSALLLKLHQLKGSSKASHKYIDRLKDGQEVYYNSCMLAYEVLFRLKINYDLGFHKSYQEQYPDYAMEYALLAFKTKKTVESLDAIIQCTKNAGIASEALGYIKSAILAGAASDEQIALSASLALEYYDFGYAGRTIKALKATIT